MSSRSWTERRGRMFASPRLVLRPLPALFALFSFAEFVQGGLLGRVGNRLGDDAAQGSDPRRRGSFLRHGSSLAGTHGERVLALQGLAAVPRGEIDLKHVESGF